MDGFLRVAVIFGMLGAAMLALILKTNMATHNVPRPARATAGTMLALHRYAVAYKAQNTGVTGALNLALPAALTGYNAGFAICADAKHVETYTTSYLVTENRDLVLEMLRQWVGAPGIGEASGTQILTLYGAITGACSVPAGTAAVQTQVLP